jgi:hypothetical protein
VGSSGSSTQDWPQGERLFLNMFSPEQKSSKRSRTLEERDNARNAVGLSTFRDYTVILKKIREISTGWVLLLLKLQQRSTVFHLVPYLPPDFLNFCECGRFGK